MTVADKMTSLRLILAPFFFIVYLYPRYFPFSGLGWTVPVLWTIFVFSEITDLLDGYLARKRDEVSDFGKLFDPFADTLTQITYFLCFVIDGIFPPFTFLIVIYREFSVLFVRNLMLKKGITMGARMSGKIKTVTYAIAGALALLASSATRLGLCTDYCELITLAARMVFALSMVLAVISLVIYVVVYFKTPDTAQSNE
ncbi:MAG: CDP-diacylglycerol--glycerol-3-phosphate 3-phosphatidyltransferase [Treponema sp.]|nr:CDP-diacylglycerol--glycerol-3-phosphate 3-phosphatidyltransferase [Treponema sp.]